MPGNQIIEKLISFRVYKDAKDLIGVATVDLPEIQAMSDTVSGAGIAGEVDSPVLGHYQSMTCTLHWRSMEPEAAALAEQKAHALELRGSQQVYDAANGEYSTQPIRMVLRAIPKNFSLGSFEVGSAQEAETEFELTYLKILVSEKEVAEIDKYNYIAKFGGNDVLASVRKDLGLN